MWLSFGSINSTFVSGIRSDKGESGIGSYNGNLVLKYIVSYGNYGSNSSVSFIFSKSLLFSCEIKSTDSGIISSVVISSSTIDFNSSYDI